MKIELLQEQTTLVRVYRMFANDDETIGVVSVDNKEICCSLEDQYQTKKVYGETRIPTGTYPLRVRTIGRLHEDYKKRFPEFHKGMIEIYNVPNFKYILFHIGNTDNDTAGCILTGRKIVLNNGRFKLEESTVGYKRFYKAVIDEVLKGNASVQII